MLKLTFYPIKDGFFYEKDKATETITVKPIASGPALPEKELPLPPYRVEIENQSKVSVGTVCLVSVEGYARMGSLLMPGEKMTYQAADATDYRIQDMFLCPDPEASEASEASEKPKTKGDK
jgi:hypothetical protein